MAYDWDDRRARRMKRILALSAMVVLVVAVWGVVVLTGLAP